MIMIKRNGSKRVMAEEAIGNVKSGQRIVIPLYSGLPQTLIEVLVADHGRLRDVEIVSGIQMIYPFLEDGLEESFSFRTWQCTPAIRHHLKKGTVKFIPMRQGDAVKVFSKRGPWPVDLAMIQVSPPDQHGYCSLGVSIGHTLPLALESDMVIAEVNPRMPRVLGNSFIHLSQIDFIVESERDLLELPSGRKPGEKELAVGGHAAELIPNGATLQIGIGAIPEAVLDCLSDKKDLQFFGTGMDKIVEMVEKGAVRIGQGPSIRVTEMGGTKKLFDFVHNNPLVEGRTLPEVINPKVIGKIPRFCSIISALEVDLTGQINAETIKGKQFSAIGGSFDFVQGALFSEEGCSIIAMASTTPDEKISRIIPQLALGSAVTTPRHSVQYIVTEYGVAEIWGRSLQERAEALINIAHPKFRDELAEEARKLF
jgi:4-hydroxybutyrate CoA-transferase